jgi:hypothetical protein
MWAGGTRDHATMGKAMVFSRQRLCNIFNVLSNISCPCPMGGLFYPEEKNHPQDSFSLYK